VEQSIDACDAERGRDLLECRIHGYPPAQEKRVSE
jgi:hypothetical protein